MAVDKPDEICIFVRLTRKRVQGFQIEVSNRQQSNKTIKQRETKERKRRGFFRPDGQGGDLCLFQM